MSQFQHTVYIRRYGRSFRLVIDIYAPVGSHLVGEVSSIEEVSPADLMVDGPPVNMSPDEFVDGS